MSEWQPIETAPKDGTRVLVWARKWVFIAYWSVDPSVWDRGNTPCWAVRECDDPFYSVWLLDEDEPTHWMPLPEPPK